MSTSQSWWMAYGKALLVVLYFVLATVWLPSWVLGIGFVERAAPVLHDLAGAGAWAIAMAVGLWALRRSQARGWI